MEVLSTPTTWYQVPAIGETPELATNCWALELSEASRMNSSFPVVSFSWR